MEKKQYGVVNLDKACQNNIVYIDLSQEQEDSIFSRQYKKAAKIISGILRKGREALDSAGNGHMGMDREPQNHLTSFHTAVPFIGDRGTGKTSVMYSIMERLRNYNGHRENAAFYLGREFNDTKFIVFDLIDVAMMKTTDDVMEIILAQMLTYLEDLATDNEFRELYRRIDELHEDLCMISGDKRGKREEYGLTALQRVADSQKAVEKFQKLVREFLLTMGKCKFSGRQCYLVVALDDVDMYQGSRSGLSDPQFALLEHVYGHLRIPGMVVLMTYNEHLLKRACNGHFEGIYFGKQKNGTYTTAAERDINALTSQFMSKFFPQEKRVYMPNYMLVDALDRPNLYVSPIYEGKRLDPFGENETCLSAKEFMLRLIAHKTGVHFDAAGTKKHFFEPRNLREFGELFQIICNMEDVDPGDEQREAIKAQNRQELLSYLKNQFAMRHLNAEEYGKFSSLMTLPLWRQNRTMIEEIRQHRKKIAKNDEDFGKLYGALEDRWSYSYGELLHNAYFATRIPTIPGGDKLYYRKEFMHCMFGTQTVQMNQAVCNAGSHEEIMKVIGSSVAGRWANRMLPAIRMSGYDNSALMGSMSLPIRSFFDWKLPKDAADNLTAFVASPPSTTKKTFPKTNLNEFIRALVTVGMFFTNYPMESLGLRLEPQLDPAEGLSLGLRSDSDEHVCFNVMNFAINLYDADNYLDFIKEKLWKLGNDFVEQLAKDWEKELCDLRFDLEKLQEPGSTKRPDMMVFFDRKRTAAKDQVNRAEAWCRLQDMLKIPQEKLAAAKWKRDAYKAWCRVVESVIDDFKNEIKKRHNSHGDNQWVLPVQNVDMMYNINKRLANVSYHDIPSDADVTEVLKNYKRLYKSLADELQKQDKVYGRTGEKSFEQAFTGCVFHQIVVGNGKSSDRYAMCRNYLKFVLTEMVSSAVRSQATRNTLRDIWL